MANRPWQNEQNLRREYVENGKSVITIADEWGCTVSTISRWLDKFDIETRQRGVEAPETTERLDQERKHRNEDWLREKYREEGLTLNEIEEQYDVSRTALLKNMDRHGIERRSRSTKNTHPSIYTDQRGYVFASSWTEDHGKKEIGIHRLVAVAHHGIEAVKDMHVHHDNEIPWDNRPANLKVWSEKKHRSHHAKQNKLHEYGAAATRGESR